AVAHPRPDLATPYVAPATEEERAVAAIWQEVLGVDRVGVDDDFFELGGHSLAAVQIGAKIRGRFGIDLEMRDFFDRPTVAGTVAAPAAAPAGGRARRRAPAAARAGGRARTEDAIPALARDEPGDDPDLDRLDELSDEEVEARLRELLAEETEERGESA
ncbi:MAG: hypothetical protein IRY90_21945, partial [Actinomadura rubrobrunea]|nr:hypothetical protein [Actinomadura rubrobrunea]